ncbi:MAG: TIGR03960 family B12-binding radical SAM protein [bacterium]
MKSAGIDYSRDIFPFVQKPSRYLGNEVNVVRKDLAAVRNRVALAFPDSYEVGMSHNGIRILYHLLNDREDIAAERVFVPWEDFETILKRKGAPLATLESRTPVRDFHILGISLLYELSASNVVHLLDLAHIPRRSIDRGPDDPLVVAGGPVVFNVEPVAPFFDAVALGDGEELFPEIVDLHERWRRSGEPRARLLERLENLSGIYVPSRYKIDHEPDGRIRECLHISGTPRPVLSRRLEDLNHSPHPTRPIIPYAQVVHDRVTLEVQRGCTRGCRFCHAGMVYRPVRDRDPLKVLELAEESLKNTGYEEISLSSLCIADYQPLKGLVPRLMERLAPMNTSISLPSLRVGAMNPELLAEIARVRRTGFTLVPEAGSERLRNVINKVLTETDLRRNLQDILDAGWPGVKFYFMLGLPTENFGDLKELVDMLHACAGMRSSHTGEPFRFINVSLSTLVPKPHTPFQWFPQNRQEEIREKLNFIRDRVKDRRIRLRWSDPRNSFFEAILSKGDRRLADVIETAVDMGCKFDGWMEHFDFEKWMAAFEAHGIDPEWYAYREISEDEPLPWDHLDCGVTKKYQLEEWRRALREVTVGDCRYESCGHCGILDKYAGIKYHYEKPMPALGKPLSLAGSAYGGNGAGPALAAADLPPGADLAPAEPVELSIMKNQTKGNGGAKRPREKRRRSPSRRDGPVPVGFEGNAAEDNPGLAAAQPDVSVSRFRFMFEKKGDLRFLSHLEMLRTFIRAVQRAGYRIEHSRGFHPHPKIVFSHALPVGFESRAELVDISLLETDGPFRLLEVFRKIQKELPGGLRPWAVWKLERGETSSANALSAATYEITLHPDSWVSAAQWADEAEAAISRVLSAETITIERKRKEKIIRFDARPAIADFEVSGQARRPDGKPALRLSLTLRYGEGAKPRISEILATCLGFSQEDCLRAHVRKLGVRWKVGKSRNVEYAI